MICGSPGRAYQVNPVVVCFDPLKSEYWLSILDIIGIETLTHRYIYHC